MQSKSFFVAMTSNVLKSALRPGAIWLTVELGRFTKQTPRSDVNLVDAHQFDLDDDVVAQKVFTSIFEGALRIDGIPWDAKVNKIAELYISSGYGKPLLDELADSATKFRLNFQKSFKVENVLLAAEDRIRSLKPK
jgi:hypothetical protein